MGTQKCKPGCGDIACNSANLCNDPRLALDSTGAQELTIQLLIGLLSPTPERANE